MKNFDAREGRAHLGTTTKGGTAGHERTDHGCGEAQPQQPHAHEDAKSIRPARAFVRLGSFSKPNPNGIVPQSPGLRGTSYPG